MCGVYLVRPWSVEEKEAIWRRRGHLVTMRRPPRKHACLSVIKEDAVLIETGFRLKIIYLPKFGMLD